MLTSTVSFAQSKADINNMLQKLKAKGMFSEKDIEAAEKQLNSMSDKDVDSLVKKGQQKLNDPEIKKKLEEYNKKN
jgi:vacuolar-type H+-ATPase subunit I/STV1